MKDKFRPLFHILITPILIYLCFVFHHQFGWKGVFMLLVGHSMSIMLYKAYIYQKEIRNILVHYETAREMLYPERHFEYILKTEEDKIDLRAVTLRNDITKKHRLKPKEELKTSTAIKIQELKGIYIECIKRYINSVSNERDKKTEFRKIQNQIDLLRDMIKKERDSFLIDNGDSTVSFIFNRQNLSTDLFLTGLAIPMLLNVFEGQPSSIYDMLTILFSNEVNCLFTCVFLWVLSYRIMKYAKNKKSMINSNQDVIAFNKADLVLTTFENALHEVIIELGSE